ncbi:cation:proton antiporter [Mycolicibacterium sp.]|uniref:cation:proton antiporter n=1 Tax=Mycolicibacterium sp. TaxID=2320850 RepID=UPI0025E11E21|nr:cation:proton antiporter [Mycolicibacterium sp.]
MHQTTPLVLAVLVLGYALVSERVNRLFVAPALIFMFAGMALGPFGFQLLDAGPGTEGYTVLAQLALALILFNQAAELRLNRIRMHGPVTLRLLVVGIPLTLALGTVTAAAVLPVLPWWEAVCLAAIVAPTEAALIEALLKDSRIPERVRHALSVESGFYDGFALAVLLIALGLASQEETGTDQKHWAWFIFSTEIVSLLIGAGIGLAGGLVVNWSRRNDWMSDTWAQLATLALAFVCFQIGEWVEASGFVAAFTGGLAFSFISRRKAGEDLPTQVSDATAQLLELMVFAMFGAFAVIDGWKRADWRVVAFAVIAVFGVRMAAVLISLVRTDMPVSNRLFIGWFGPRGIGTVVLGLLVINRGDIESGGVIGTVVVVAVTLSLVLHSATAAPGIRRLAASRLTPSP